MERITSNGNILSSLYDRTSRINKIHWDKDEFDDDTLEEFAIDVPTSKKSSPKKTRARKKPIKSGFDLTPTFPLNVDFNHPYRQILMAVKTKPFILMAGMCGTGKSRFARTLAYQTCPKYLQEGGRPGNFQMIAVQPDWHGNDEILGWLSSQGVYQITPFLHFLIKAWKYPDTPFILCLDEMNLAKVELYFADYLSILESRQWINDQIFSDAFISADKVKSYAECDPNFWIKLGLKLDDVLQNRFLTSGFTLPPNLIVIGTANVDESGHRLSMKVLDRIMVIELSAIDFYGGIKSEDTDLQFPDNPLLRDYVLGRLLQGRSAYELLPADGDLIISELQAIDKILSDSRFRFGYRVRDAALIYCAYNSQLENKSNESQIVYKCLDEIFLMKIIPRIEGRSTEIEKILTSLLHFTKGKYPSSFQRLTVMQSEMNDMSFISFW